MKNVLMIIFTLGLLTFSSQCLCADDTESSEAKSRVTYVNSDENEMTNDAGICHLRVDIGNGKIMLFDKSEHDKPLLLAALKNNGLSDDEALQKWKAFQSSSCAMRDGKCSGTCEGGKSCTQTDHGHGKTCDCT
jgi:hypothetical protein